MHVSINAASLQAGAVAFRATNETLVAVVAQTSEIRNLLRMLPFDPRNEPARAFRLSVLDDSLSSVDSLTSAPIDAA